MSSHPNPANPLTRRNLILASTIIGLYVVAYLFVYRRVGLPGALAVIPIVVCSWLFGQRRGFIASLLITAITMSLILILGGGWSRIVDTWLGLVLLPVIGAAIGWFRKLYDHVQTQTANLKQTQAELRRLNLELEQRVAERTEEIRHLNTDLEQRVIARTEELTATNAQLESFGNMVAHDLRTPLTLTQSYNDLLRLRYANQILDEEALQMLEAMQEANQAMARLIQDLFDFSRAKDSEIQLQPVNLSELAQILLGELRQREPARQVAVNVAPALTVQGDERLLRVVLDNLLNNAWKYSGPTRQPRIELGSHPTQINNHISYFVRDNGVGFDMAQADRLFQPFRRLNSEFPGTGLGLATCKRIIERHGGRIWVESQLGIGTTFYFTLSG